MTPLPRATMGNEHAEQVALVQWAAWKQGATVGAERAMEGRSVKNQPSIDMDAYRAMSPEEKIQVLTVWHEMAVRVIERQAALIEDLRIGAEQRSQSHVDVLAKIAAFRGGE